MPGIDETLVNAIVAGVLARLGQASVSSAAPVVPSAVKAAGLKRTVPDLTLAKQPEQTHTERKHAGKTQETAPAAGQPTVRQIAQAVITEQVLIEQLQGAKRVEFAEKAVITPTGRDYLRIHGIEWSRGRKSTASGTDSRWGVVIVRNTPNLDRLRNDRVLAGRVELMGCPDDAANWMIAELSRGGIAGGVIFATQSHRAACLANRHTAVKAVAVQTVREIAEVRKQLRANVWCISPNGRSYMELKNMLRGVQAGA